MKLPRKTKKQLKNITLIYDIASIPKSIDMQSVLYAYKTHALVLWDSSNGGDKPQIIGKNKNRIKLEEYDKYISSNRSKL